MSKKERCLFVSQMSQILKGLVHFLLVDALGEVDAFLCGDLLTFLAPALFMLDRAAMPFGAAAATGFLPSKAFCPLGETPGERVAPQDAGTIAL